MGGRGERGRGKRRGEWGERKREDGRGRGRAKRRGERGSEKRGGRSNSLGPMFFLKVIFTL